MGLAMRNLVEFCNRNAWNFTINYEESSGLWSLRIYSPPGDLDYERKCSSLLEYAVKYAIEEITNEQNI